MENLVIEETEDTPLISFDAGTGVLALSGSSLPEDALGYYEPVLAWVESYLASQNNSTNVDFKLDYFNTASSKQLYKLFGLFSRMKDNITINWYYEPEDEDILRSGERFAQLLDMKFNFKTYEN